MALVTCSCKKAHVMTVIVQNGHKWACEKEAQRQAIKWMQDGWREVGRCWDAETGTLTIVYHNN